MAWTNHGEVWNGDMTFMGGKARLIENSSRSLDKHPSHKVLDAEGYEIGAFWPGKFSGEDALSGRIRGFKATILWKKAFLRDYGVLRIDTARELSK